MLFIASEAGWPEESRTLFRFLTNPERFSLQGKNPELAPRLKKMALAQKASGNAYPTPLVVAVAAPMIRVIGESGQPLPSPCTPPVEGTSYKVVTKKVIAMLKVRKRIGKPKAKGTAKANSKKKPTASVRRLRTWGSM